MIVDASAIVAILRREPEAASFIDRLAQADRRLTHPISVYEAATAIMRLKGCSAATAHRDLVEFISNSELVFVEIGQPETLMAVEAFSRYGKGRHPAALNMGDCFSYACAKLRGVPLLYKGDDFSKTDLA